MLSSPHTKNTQSKILDMAISEFARASRGKFDDAIIDTKSYLAMKGGGAAKFFGGESSVTCSGGGGSAGVSVSGGRKRIT